MESIKTKLTWKAILWRKGGSRDGQEDFAD